MTAGVEAVSNRLFPYDRWTPQLKTLSQRYQKADPYPHIVLENLLENSVCEKTLSEFPSAQSGEWIHYMHVNEKKLGRTDLTKFGPSIQALIKELNSDRFVAFLTELTGIQGLFSDNSLEGGGLHQTSQGGFLNIHADFTVHPHHRNWRRRVNLLLYLNPGWQDTYGGHLELWDRKMKARAQKIAPVFNRSVIFNTDADAFHGHPEPLTCPDGMTRKSIALYYFTEEKSAPKVQSTEYRARPSDSGLKGVLIYLDKWVLRIYDAVKRILKINDDFASNALKKISRLKEKKNKPKN